MIIMQDTQQKSLSFYRSIDDMLEQGYREKYEKALNYFAKTVEKPLEQAEKEFRADFAWNMTTFGVRGIDTRVSAGEVWSSSPSEIMETYKFHEFNPTSEDKEKALKHFSENLTTIYSDLNDDIGFTFARNEKGEFELTSNGDEYDTAWQIMFNDNLTSDGDIILGPWILDSAEDSNDIKLSTLFDYGLLTLVDDIEGYTGYEEVSWQDFVSEAQDIIARNVEKAQEGYFRMTAANKLEAIFDWCKENGYDHIIVEKTSDKDTPPSFYFARQNDELPAVDETSEIRFEHISFERWANMVLDGEMNNQEGREGENLYIPIPEPYEEMYAREVAEVEAIRFMKIDDRGVPIELSARIYHRFESDENGGLPQFVDDAEEPSFVMATAEIDGELFSVYVSEEGINEDESVLLTEDDHRDYEEINLTLQEIAKSRLVEVLNGCIPVKAEEYGKSQNWDKEHIDTLAKNTQIRRSSDEPNRIHVKVILPTLDEKEKPQETMQIEVSPFWRNLYSSMQTDKTTFTVQISETMKQSYQIEAASEEEAIKIAQEGYEREELGPTIETNRPFAAFEIVRDRTPEKKPLREQEKEHIREISRDSR